MKQIWLILLIAATCQAAQQTVGNPTVFQQVAYQDERCAEAFTMPTSGRIETISIYHEGGSGQMLLGVYLGDTWPDACVAVTAPTAVSASTGWQTIPLISPVWISTGKLIWLAWVFEDNPGIRYQTTSSGWVQGGQGWTGSLPGSFGTDWQSNRLYSIYASYVSDPHPVINEVMPRNDTLSGVGFWDEDWTRQGWIEIYNPTDGAISLSGYYLSDDANVPQKWAFPAVVINSHQFLQVWTSGKNRRASIKALHASFNLMERGTAYLTYLTPENKIDVLESIRIPVDHSYGRYPDGSSTWSFYTQPTPALPNTAENRKSFVIDQRLVSLTAGTPLQLTVTPERERIVWDSNNPRVQADSNGRLFAAQDVLGLKGESTRATVTAASVDGTCVDSCKVTIVNWTADVSELKVVGTPRADYVLGTEGERLFYLIGRDLYCTSDGFATSQKLSTLPEDMVDIPKMLVTPFGYFVQCAKVIYKSVDLVYWTPSFTLNMKSLYHGLDYHWDPNSRTGYIYAGEYSCDDPDHHRVCRGIFPANGPETWQTILDFASVSEWQADPSIPLAARHVHSVFVDPYTGHVWVTTGDTYEHARLLYSDDNGESFRLVAVGSQKYRCLSMWFTERYVYWVMDTWDPQSCWRIPRSVFNERGYWPCATPEIASQTTKVGVKYIVTASDIPSRFPAAVGRIYQNPETVARPLDEENRVRAVDDPAYDYKEKVADLVNGSFWYHMWVHDDQGDPVLILGQSAEGGHRDNRGRVFGIKELANGKVDIQDLLSIVPAPNAVGPQYVQLEPKAQDPYGNIYFTGALQTTSQRCYKTRLTWVDNPLLR
jgi:hypothetical protein